MHCCSQRLADTFNGGQLSCMALAMAREPTAFRSLLIRPGAVLAAPGAILARLVRGHIALAVSARVPAVADTFSTSAPADCGELSFPRTAVAHRHAHSERSVARLDRVGAPGSSERAPGASTARRSTA